MNKISYFKMNALNPQPLKLFGVQFSLREIRRIFFPLKYEILSFEKRLNQ